IISTTSAARDEKCVNARAKGVMVIVWARHSQFSRRELRVESPPSIANYRQKPTSGMLQFSYQCRFGFDLAHPESNILHREASELIYQKELFEPHNVDTKMHRKKVRLYL